MPTPDDRQFVLFRSRLPRPLRLLALRQPHQGGVRYGEEAPPDTWLAEMELREVIANMAEALCAEPQAEVSHASGPVRD